VPQLVERGHKVVAMTRSRSNERPLREAGAEPVAADGVGPDARCDQKNEKEDTMRTFVAGASGALGSRLVPQLIDAGHDVIGTHNSLESAELLRTLGAKPVMVDLLDARAVRKAVLENEPEAIVHQATALANAKWGRSLDKTLAKTNELRTKGTDALLAAARAAGVRRFVAQSFAPYRYAREGGPVKAEDDPLDAAPPPNTQQTSAAMTYLENAVTDFGGIALRYGGFYGAANDALIEPVRKRRLPIVADGVGIFPWIHLEDAATATVLALEHEGPAIYNIVDDDPAPVREWLPVLAQALDAKPPRRFPTWLARLFAGEAAVVMGTESRGASNAKAKRELGWTPRYPSWRRGFSATYSAIGLADRPRPHPATRTNHSPGLTGSLPVHRSRRPRALRRAPRPAGRTDTARPTKGGNR
jgi:2-alkyl-3-oxoalkanoate reductase